MKKLLLILFFASGVFAGISDTVIGSAGIGSWKNVNVWSAATFPGSLDTTIHKTGINDTLDTTISVAAVRIPPVSGTWWSTAGKTLTVSSFFVDSGTETVRTPDSIAIIGNTGYYRNSSGNGGRITAQMSISFSGSNCVLSDYKGLNPVKAIVIGNGAILTNNGSSMNTTLQGATSPLVFINGGSLIMTRRFIVQLTSTGSHISFLGTLPTIVHNDGSFLTFRASNGVTSTIPAMSITGTGVGLSLTGGGTGCTVVYTLGGNLTLPGFMIAPGYETTTLTLNAVTYNITTNILTLGGILITDNCTFNMGSGNHTITSFVTNVTGTNAFHFQTSQFSCSGSWTMPSGANQTVDATNTTQSVTFTGMGTTTNSGQTFPGNVIVNAPGVLRTMTEKFRCAGNYTQTAGSVIFGNLSRDSIVGDYTNALASTDSVNWNADSLWLGGSFTGNLRTKNDLARKYLYGTALCNFTTNGAKINHIDVRGDTRAKQIKLIDRHTIRKLQVTIGTLNTNGQDCFADSFIVVKDSIATVLGDTISSRKITFSPTAKLSNVTPLLLYFGLALKDTLFDTLPATARTIGNVIIQKTGDTLTQAGVVHGDTLKFISGGYRTANVTDTSYWKAVSITSSSVFTLTAPMVISGSLTLGAGVDMRMSGDGKIILDTTATTHSVTLNGDSIPNMLVKYAQFQDSGRVVATIADSAVISFKSAAGLRLYADTASLNGRASYLNTYSASSTAQARLWLDGVKTWKYASVAGISVSPAQIVGTGMIDGGNTAGWGWPSTSRSRHSFGFNMGFGF
jgi:hypothetical protein